MGVKGALNLAASARRNLMWVGLSMRGMGRGRGQPLGGVCGVGGVLWVTGGSIGWWEVGRENAKQT